MYEPRSLKLLDRFQGLFSRLGIDYPVMRRILQVKLTMDARRVPTIVGKSKQSSDSSAMNERNQFVRSLWVYAIYGALCSVFMWVGDNYFFSDEPDLRYPDVYHYDFADFRLFIRTAGYS